MNISRKFNPKLIAALTALAMILILTYPANGNYNNRKFFYNSLTAYQDTTKPTKKDSLNKKDTIPSVKSDTINLKISKDSIDAPIDYSASDSVVLEVPTKKIVLYNKANVKQKDLDLSAYKIELEQKRAAAH